MKPKTSIIATLAISSTLGILVALLKPEPQLQAPASYDPPTPEHAKVAVASPPQARASERRLRLPRFESNPERSAAQLALLHYRKEDSYDPTALLVAGHTAGNLFESEKTDPTWAKPMQDKIMPQLEQDLTTLGPMTHLDGIECRTSICRVVVSAPLEKQFGVAIIMQGLSRADVADLGERTQVGDRGEYEVFLVFNPNNRKLNEAADQVYLTRRSQVLAQWKRAQTGELPFDPPEQ